jgi:DNA-binding IclR family transcriptional regulator
VTAPNGQRTMALTCGAARTRLNKETLMRRVAPALKALAAQIAPLLARENVVRR